MSKQNSGYTDVDADRDEDLATPLLHSALQEGPDGFLRYRFLSKETSPTEDEARAALTRLLIHGRASKAIQALLAEVFAPDGFCPPEGMDFLLGKRRAIFRNRTRGHPADPIREVKTAWEVLRLRKSGMSADDACASVAEKCGMRDGRQVKKICSRWAPIVGRPGQEPSWLLSMLKR
jgi:hypothetical protein